MFKTNAYIFGKKVHYFGIFGQIDYFQLESKTVLLSLCLCDILPLAQESSHKQSSVRRGRSRAAQAQLCTRMAWLQPAPPALSDPHPTPRSLSHISWVWPSSEAPLGLPWQWEGPVQCLVGLPGLPHPCAGGSALGHHSLTGTFSVLLINKLTEDNLIMPPAFGIISVLCYKKSLIK